MTTTPMADTQAKLGAIFRTMNLEQLRTANRTLVGEINQRHAVTAAKAMERFRIGDLIEFVDDKRGRKVTARVGRINQKSISCREIDGLQIPWRVAPSMCRLVGA